MKKPVHKFKLTPVERPAWFTADLAKRIFSYVNSGNVIYMAELLNKHRMYVIPHLPKLIDRNGNSLLCRAAKKGDYEMAKLLLNNMLDVNYANHTGNTALHLAI